MRRHDRSLRVSVVAGAVGLLMLSGVSLVIPGVVYAQGNSAAEAEIRFQQLEKEIRRLTGQIEEQQYDIRQLRDQISELQGGVSASEVQALAPANGSVGGGEYDDHDGGAMAQSQGYREGIYAKPLNDRREVDVAGHRSLQPPPFENETVQSLGTYTKPVGNDGRVASGNSAGTDVVMASTGDASGDYDRAYSYIKARDFDNAEHAFDAFIKAYPDNDLTSNAKYWYGETFYVRGNYERSARIFAEGYQKYPQGPKAASNLLKLGMSLVGMGKSDDACIAFKQLKTDYSKSAIPVLKRADNEMEKIGCQ